MNMQRSSDEQVQRRIRARRQLSGAVVLLALAAWLVPWLFDNAPRHAMQPAGTVAVDNGVSVSVLAEPGSAAVGPSSHPVATSQPVPPPVSGAASAPAHEARSATVAASAVPVVAGQVRPVPLRTVQAVSSAAPSAGKPGALHANPVHVVPAREKPAVPRAVAAKGRYAIQLGVFGQAEHVRQVRARLQSIGIASYTESLPSGVTRVRVGPFSTRAEAERKLAAIRLADLPAQVVPLAP